LAKHLLVTFSALNRLELIHTSTTIKALMPENESLISKALEIGIAEGSKDSTIIYGDIVAPRNDIFIGFPSLKYRLVGESFIVDPHESKNQIRLLLPAHAVLWPSKTYLSRGWLELLQSQKKQDVLLITPPLSDSKGFIAESYLCALGASQIHIVR
jgi:hypothetical protein